MEYQWRSGARIKLDAQTAGEELERIRARDGKVETVTIVNEARPETSPLHSAFEWDDSAAGEQWRLLQARNLIRAIEVAPAKKGEEPLPAFVHVRPVSSEEPGYYQSVTVALRNPDEWASALGELRVKAESAAKAVEQLLPLAAKKSRKTKALVKKAGAALGDAKAAIAEIAE